VDSSCEKSPIKETELQELKNSLLELCIDREGKKREVLPDALHVIDLEFAIFGGLSWESEFSRADKPAAH
jgi:hypothetical protein